MHSKSLSYICSSWCEVITLLLLCYLVILRVCQFVELFKLKFKLYLRVTQTSAQAATDIVENYTYPITKLRVLRDPSPPPFPRLHSLTNTEAQSVNVKNLHVPSLTQVQFLFKYCYVAGGGACDSVWQVICVREASSWTYILQCLKLARVRFQNLVLCLSLTCLMPGISKWSM